MRYIQNIDNLSWKIEGETTENEFLVAIFYSSENICDLLDSDCITFHGIYFGTDDEREPKFCPRHYFEENGYKLIIK